VVRILNALATYAALVATYVAFMGYNPLFVSFFGTALPTVFSTSVPNPQLLTISTHDI
jgi:hypothetical protein